MPEAATGEAAPSYRACRSPSIAENAQRLKRCVSGIDTPAAFAIKLYAYSMAPMSRTSCDDGNLIIQKAKLNMQHSTPSSHSSPPRMHQQSRTSSGIVVYAQAVTSNKRAAQSKVIQMLVSGVCTAAGTNQATVAFADFGREKCGEFAVIFPFVPRLCLECRCGPP